MEGSRCERIFFVLSGRVKLYRTASSGRQQILETLGPGDTCACNPGSANWSCTATAEAMAASTVWFLSRDHYVRIVNSNSKITRTLNQLFADRLRNLNCLIEEVSLKDVKKRVVKFLLDMLSERKNEGGRSDLLFISFTREEIAQRLGTARETVTRYLSDLQSEQLIAIRPKQILIKDQAGLQKLLL